MYASAGIPIPREIACGMLGAIISDTLLFSSPTTTQEDRDASAKLAQIAGVEDIQAFGHKQLQAKSSIEGMSADSLLKQDLKTFDMHGRKVGVAQLELMDLSIVATRKDEFLSVMKTLKGEGYHSVLLMLTDIGKQGTDLLVVSDNVRIIESAFGLKEKWPWKFAQAFRWKLC
jgi:manganese-dependent inorganic pyrophosphatase